MKSLQEAEDVIADIEGASLAHATFISALLRTMSARTLRTLQRHLSIEAERSRVLLLNVASPDRATESFEGQIQTFAEQIRDQLAG